MSGKQLNIHIFAAAALILVCTACNHPAPQEQIHQIMTNRMVTLATAESCTGGVIASRFTAMPGASAYFKCGIVAYSNSCKFNILGVRADTLGRYGVVSEQVVRQMAEGARRVANADYAIATTGFAGPSGGTPECPIGTVWIAVATPLHTVSKQTCKGTTRDEVIDMASSEAIWFLLDELQQE